MPEIDDVAVSVAIGDELRALGYVDSDSMLEGDEGAILEFARQIGRGDFVFEALESHPQVDPIDIAVELKIIAGEHSLFDEYAVRTFDFFDAVINEN